MKAICSKGCLILIWSLVLFLSPGQTFSNDFPLGTALRDYFKAKLVFYKKGNPNQFVNPISSAKSTSELSRYAKSEDRNLIKKLNEVFKLNEEELNLLDQIPYEALRKMPWFYSPNVTYYSEYYQIIRSVSKRIMPDVLKSLGYNFKVVNPVIHYRLSDVPFIRNDEHHLQNYNFYIKSLKKLQSSGVNCSKVIILCIHNHTPRDRNKRFSKRYLQDFISFLTSHGYKVKVESGKALEDFAKMVFAPATISAASTFSLFAGLGCQGKFISPLIIKESERVNGVYQFPKKSRLPFFMSLGPPLLHQNVKNYYDEKKVFQLLRMR